MTDAAPATLAFTEPTLAYTVLVCPVALTAAGFVELQVRGTAVRFMPRVSVAVAFKVVVVPEFTATDVGGLPTAVIETLATGQVVKGNDWLFTPLVLAEIKVTPDVVAVTVSWFNGAPVAGAVSVTTLV
jgi:hypothetical protein